MSGQGLPVRAEPSDRKLVDKSSAPPRVHSKLPTVQRVDIPTAHQPFYKQPQGRTIRPAPVSGAAVVGQSPHLVAQVPGPKLLSVGAQHPGVTRLPAQVMGNTGTTSQEVGGPNHTGSSQSLPGPAHLAQATPVVTLSSQLTGSAIQTITMPGSLTPHAAGSAIFNTFPMASLISRSLPANQALSHSVTNTTLSGSSIAQTVSALQSPTYPIPRGPAAMSTLAAPKSSNTATHILRPSQPANVTAVHFPTATTVATPTIIPTIAGQLTPRQLIAAARSPAVSLASGSVVGGISESHRGLVNVLAQPTAGSTAVTATTAAVQLTMTQQQPRTIEVTTRQLTSRQVTVPQSVAQHMQMGHLGSQKAVGQPAHLQPQPVGGSTGPVSGPRVSTAMNLSQSVRPQKIPTASTSHEQRPPSGVMQSSTRPPKVVVTHGTTHLHPTVNMAAKQGAPLNLTQGARGQKVVIPAVIPSTMSPAVLPKPVGAAVPGPLALSNLTTVSTASSPAINNTIPIAKVPPQPSTGITMAGHPDHPSSAPPRPPPHTTTSATLGQVGSAGQRPQLPVPASSPFISQGHRPSQVFVTAAVTSTLSMVVTSTERPHPDMVTRMSFAHSGQLPYVHPTDYGVYSKLYLQPQTAQQHAARPMAASSQTPNLAATLQAVSQQPGTTPMVPVATPAAAIPVSRPTDVTSHPVPAVPQPIATASQNISIATAQQPATAQPPASPARPSILRKRPNEGVAMVRKNILGSGSVVETVSAADTTMPTSPKSSSLLDPSRENSQSSTDTASSTDSAPVTAPTGLHIKQELDVLDNGSSQPNSMEASPRKKPRKQLLHATEQYEVDEGSSSDDGDLISAAKLNLKHELEKVAEEVKTEELEEFVDEEGVRWTRDKRRHPGLNLLNYYTCTWKTRNNHFLRYSDVKAKDERRPTVNELANLKGIHTKASGWKLYHLTAQMEDLMELERDVCVRLTGVQDNVAPNSSTHQLIEDDLSMVHELTQGNLQRCQLLMDQLQEAKISLIKVLDHQTRIGEIITRHHSKRPVKKKERS